MNQIKSLDELMNAGNVRDLSEEDLAVLLTNLQTAGLIDNDFIIVDSEAYDSDNVETTRLGDYKKIGDALNDYYYDWDAEDDWESEEDSEEDYVDPEDQEAYDKFIANGHTEAEIFDDKQNQMKDDFKTYFNDKYHTDYKSFDEINDAYKNGELDLNDETNEDSVLEYYMAGDGYEEFDFPIERIKGCFWTNLEGRDLTDEDILSRLGNPNDYEVVGLTLPDTSTLDYSVPEEQRCYEVMRTSFTPMDEVYAINKADELAKANTSVEPSEE